jgi:hypothetical protein
LLILLIEVEVWRSEKVKMSIADGFLRLFSGRNEDWDSWLFGFMARAVIHNYDSILMGDENAPTHEEDKAIEPGTKLAVAMSSLAEVGSGHHFELREGVGDYILYELS